MVAKTTARTTAASRSDRRASRDRRAGGAAAGAKLGGAEAGAGGAAVVERPPPGASPADFFERWLPQAFAAGGAEAPPDAPLVRVSLSGADGGEWELQAQGTELRVKQNPVGPRARSQTGPMPGLWIRQSVPDFLAAFEQDPDLPELLPAGWGPLDILFLDHRDVDLVKQIDGRLLVELNGRRRRRWALDLATGKAGLAAGRPRATVRVDGPTYEGLKDGSLPPLKALLERKVTVDGDRALAMQALMLLGSRLSR
jgi:hypothetical protein